MKAKEKAEELINQYRIILMNADTDCGNEILCTSIAIENAKKTVQEVMFFMDKFDLDLSMEIQYKWWSKVYDELNKL